MKTAHSEEEHSRPSPRPAEQVCIAGFIALAVFMPLVWVEMYPFTLTPMYSYRVESVTTFRVRTEHGQIVPPAMVGLRPETNGASFTSAFHRRRGRIQRDQVNIYNQPPPTDEEVAQVIRRWAAVSLPDVDRVVVDRVRVGSDPESDALAERLERSFEVELR